MANIDPKIKILFKKDFYVLEYLILKHKLRCWKKTADAVYEGETSVLNNFIFYVLHYQFFIGMYILSIGLA